MYTKKVVKERQMYKIITPEGKEIDITAEEYICIRTSLGIRKVDILSKPVKANNYYFMEVVSRVDSLLGKLKY